MGNVFEVTDCRGRKVVCSEETWIDKILNARSWMKGQESLVAEAIQKPSYICTDSKDPRRQVYYLLHQKGIQRYVKAVVSFTAEENGSVVTAYHTDTVKVGEKILCIPSSR